MGKCWNCGTEVFLKEEEVSCDRCKKIVRYWCNSCKQPFDVQDKKTRKKVQECKWCRYFLCPHCNSCSPNCPKYEHSNKIKKILGNLISIDKWKELDNKIQQIIEYFEDIKFGIGKTMCEFGVPKTYAKERIKQILARMDGFKVRDIEDQKAFEKKQEEVLDEEISYEFTIGNTRDNGSYGQEYRDVFNLCVCMGTLKYEKKYFQNNKGTEIGYDSWTRIEETQCPYLDIKELIVKICPKCKKVFNRNETYCNECIYKKRGKKHEKGSKFELIEKLSDNPTCRNIRNFKKGGKEGGESKFERED